MKPIPFSGMNCLPSKIEKDGEFKGLPTIYELKLISMLCTTICCKELSELINKI